MVHSRIFWPISVEVCRMLAHAMTMAMAMAIAAGMAMAPKSQPLGDAFPEEPEWSLFELES